MIRLPKRLNSRAPGAAWLNQLRDCVEAMRQSRTSSTHTDETVRGTLIRAGRIKKSKVSIPLNWRGEWESNPTVSYKVGDIVIRGYWNELDTNATILKTLLRNGIYAGTYILENLPDTGAIPDPAEQNTFNADGKPVWQTFARATWPALAVTKQYIADGAENLPGIILDEAECKTPIGTGKTLRVREVPICVDGSIKYALVIMSEPYEEGT